LRAGELADFGDNRWRDGGDFSRLQIAVPTCEGEGNFVAARIAFESGVPFFAWQTVDAFCDIGGNGVEAFSGAAVDEHAQEGAAF